LGAMMLQQAVSRQSPSRSPAPPPYLADSNIKFNSRNASKIKTRNFFGRAVRHR
jgi:hypothetical protein